MMMMMMMMMIGSAKLLFIPAIHFAVLTSVILIHCTAHFTARCTVILPCTIFPRCILASPYRSIRPWTLFRSNQM